MLEKMDWMMIGMKNRVGKYLERIKNEEDGSVMIEIVVLIVIIILVSAIFRRRLGEAIETVFDRLNSFVTDTQ